MNSKAAKKVRKEIRHIISDKKLDLIDAFIVVMKKPLKIRLQYAWQIILGAKGE